MDSLKILFVGNSFAVDTMEHTAEIAFSLGVKKIKFGTLYVGGCSIESHYKHASEDLGVYIYYVNEGEGWSSTPDYKISDAIQSDEWDWIAIQHGTNAPSRYTSIECYDKLGALVDYIKNLAPKAKIAFNLTWMGEPDFPHHEIISYGGNTALMREKLVEVTAKVMADNPQIDLLVPTGTAIENARTASKIGVLTRDGYHLSYDKGRYIGGLTFISTVTGIDAQRIEWAPDGVDEYAKQVAVESVKNAQKSPFEITKSTL